ncbi:MAG: hypothetical protein QW153_00825 [Candidatus Bilamarchaeaceae archaeon]
MSYLVPKKNLSPHKKMKDSFLSKAPLFDENTKQKHTCFERVCEKLLTIPRRIYSQELLPYLNNTEKIIANGIYDGKTKWEIVRNALAVIKLPTFYSAVQSLEKKIDFWFENGRILKKQNTDRIKEIVNKAIKSKRYHKEILPFLNEQEKKAISVIISKDQPRMRDVGKVIGQTAALNIIKRLLFYLERWEQRGVFKKTKKEINQKKPFVQTLTELKNLTLQKLSNGYTLSNIAWDYNLWLTQYQLLEYIINNDVNIKSEELARKLSIVPAGVFYTAHSLIKKLSSEPSIDKNRRSLLLKVRKNFKKIGQERYEKELAPLLRESEREVVDILLKPAAPPFYVDLPKSVFFYNQQLKSINKKIDCFLKFGKLKGFSIPPDGVVFLLRKKIIAALKEGLTTEQIASSILTKKSSILKLKKTLNFIVANNESPKFLHLAENCEFEKGYLLHLLRKTKKFLDKKTTRRSRSGSSQ